MVRVLLDVDGVVADYANWYLQGVEYVTGRRYRPKDVRCWDFSKALGLTPGEAAAVDRYNASRPLVLIDPYPGALDAVKQLAAVADVVFVTSPSWTHRDWVYSREMWLRDRFLDIPTVHTNHKAVVSGDLMIDDRLENIVKWLEFNPGGHGILWAQPWNDGSYPDVVVRTDSWPEVISYVATRGLQ